MLGKMFYLAGFLLGGVLLETPAGAQVQPIPCAGDYDAARLQGLPALMTHIAPLQAAVVPVRRDELCAQNTDPDLVSTCRSAMALIANHVGLIGVNLQAIYYPFMEEAQRLLEHMQMDSRWIVNNRNNPAEQQYLDGALNDLVGDFTEIMGDVLGQRAAVRSSHRTFAAAEEIALGPPLAVTGIRGLLATAHAAFTGYVGPLVNDLSRNNWGGQGSGGSPTFR